MKNTIIFYLLILLTCCSNNFMNGENPTKKGFKYYNSNFKTDSLTYLKTNKKYFVNTSIGVAILVFFEDGFLNKYNTKYIEAVSGTRNETGVVMGYYKTVNDSIFFSKKVIISTNNHFMKEKYLKTAYM